MVQMVRTYGTAVAGSKCPILADGYDCVCLRVRGRPLWVPNYILSPLEDWEIAQLKENEAE